MKIKLYFFNKEFSMIKILFVYVNIYLIGNEIKIGILLLICYLKIKVY